MTAEMKRQVSVAVREKLGVGVALAVWGAIEVAERTWDAQATNNYGERAEKLVKEQD